MQSLWLTVSFAAALLLTVIVKFWLATRQMRHVAAHSNSVPPAFAGTVSLEAFFHYRNLDVSTLKELARRWKPAALEGIKKAQAHTALADIHESIDELLHYRQHLLAV